MEKLPVHFPLPLGVIADRRSRAGANLSLFGNFCHENGIAGNNVMEMLENLSIFFGRNNYSSYRDATKLAQNCFITLFPTMPRKWYRKIMRIEKCMCSPHTSKSNCHFCGMGGNNVINQFCASFVAWRETTFKKSAGWIGLREGFKKKKKKSREFSLTPSREFIIVFLPIPNGQICVVLRWKKAREGFWNCLLCIPS